MDRLAHVKEFYFARILSGIGQREFVGQDGLPEHLKIVHNKILPALFDGIRADDPDYDPHGLFVGWPAPGDTSDDPALYKTQPTEARGTAGVRWYVELMEMQRATSDRSGDLYTYLFKPSVQYGCFLDDLTAALRADDPDWRRT